MPSSKQDEAFAKEMQAEVELSNATLDNALDWIRSNLELTEVFAEKELIEWAESNGYVKAES